MNPIIAMVIATAGLKLTAELKHWPDAVYELIEPYMLVKAAAQKSSLLEYELIALPLNESPLQESKIFWQKFLQILYCKRPLKILC
jgi:hypothetical protein